MTVYARSDVSAVTISRDHGGCGEVHSRPVVAGAPARMWALTCHAGCENHLRSDPLWASTPETIPETPDETAIRTDAERRGQVEQQASTVKALNDLAKLGDLPNAIARLAEFMAGNASQALTQQVLQLCRSGHQNPQGTKFCGECGADMNAAVNTPPAAPLPPAPTPSSSHVVPSAEDMDALSLNELKEIAKSVGAPTTRSKQEQIALIQQKQQAE